MATLIGIKYARQRQELLEKTNTVIALPHSCIFTFAHVREKQKAAEERRAPNRAALRSAGADPTAEPFIRLSSRSGRFPPGQEPGLRVLLVLFDLGVLEQGFGDRV